MEERKKAETNSANSEAPQQAFEPSPSKKQKTAPLITEEEKEKLAQLYVLIRKNPFTEPLLDDLSGDGQKKVLKRNFRQMFFLQ
jgi:hypothetical protein